MSADNIDDDGAGSVSSEDENRCVKLKLPEHIEAYIKKQELHRDVEPSTCDSTLLENVTANYVIAKKIISNLTWQDKSLCKHVCSMWHSAVNSIKREQLWPTDFSVCMRMNSIEYGIKLLKSGNFYTEPLAVLVFTNRTAFIAATRCESLIFHPCEPACEKEHYLIDVIQREVAAPKNCMVTVKGCFVSYLPLPQTSTYKNTIRHAMLLDPDPFLSGISIPAIPNVKFTVINMASVNLIKENFFDVVDKLAETHYIKGALVFANDSYLLHSVEDIIFLNHFKNVQPNVPFAMGGCIVEDTITDQADITHVINGLNRGKDFISRNLISIALFSVPRDMEQDQNCNFDMFSLILESSDWSKPKIQSCINKFSKSIPCFEHSVAIKFSCVGRDQKHELEQQYFRAAFPNTRLIGCYGNGELGINHPVRNDLTDPEEPPKALKIGAKRHRRDPGPQFGLMYSYSTIFVYIGWGKILSQPEST
ncbi:unnamed protein product [Arctia plantaginis]|uniref:Uncharacterized protein n=1 Tax=Arctia plantaginis TaxID=874455 RepID=A0A8S0ZXX9_ARCPL|nr:unnamed protein product [Arctia plantaginis]CAB3260004.1 unnamed protein product [Arctia plantaginis]